jgi:WhiB family redox-sensing transcriptional regulator
MDWSGARCREVGVPPALFFSDGIDRERAAKKVCGACPIRIKCLAYALEATEPAGIWGGLNVKERKLLQSRVDLLERRMDRGRAALAVAREHLDVQETPSHRLLTDVP